jgi:hypothetical protein
VNIMTRAIAAVAAVSVITLWAAACNKSTSTAPSPAGTPAGTPGIVSIAIDGPSRIAPGETAQFRVMATSSDGRARDYTGNFTWDAYPAGVVTVARDSGRVTGVASGDAWVSVRPLPGCTAGCNATAAITVLPPNTYRLTGKVLESGLGVHGAIVTVLSGVGSGASATTQYDGQYRLYGLAGPVQLKVAKDGYVDLVTPFAVTQDDVLDFADARQVTVVSSIAATYTLTIQADSGCPTDPPAPGRLALPAEFQRPRSFTAQLAQTGVSLLVTLPAAQFAAPTNQFSGRIKPDLVEFQIGTGYIGYGPDNGITERLSETQVLTFEGTAYTRREGSALIGRLDGNIALYNRETGSAGPFYRFAGGCTASNHSLAMRASTGLSR